MVTVCWRVCVYARRAEGEVVMLRGEEVERSLRIEVKMRITRNRKGKVVEMM